MAKTSVLISSLAAVAVVGGLAYWVVSVDENPEPVPTPSQAVQNTNPNAIANRWQWDNFTVTETASEPSKDDANPEVEKPLPASEVLFDVVEIYDVLQSIQLDEYGGMVPDQAAREALDNAFVHFGPDLSPAAMLELQNLIRIGLPGAAGEEAARMLKNYYDYRLAEEEFSQQLPNDGQLPTAESYEELVQLRRRFLGEEIADRLFAVEDIQARHMLSMIAIQQDSELTEEEKQSQQAALHETLNDRLIALGQLEAEEAAALEVQRLRKQGASNAEIYAAREAILGEERAQELATADLEEEQWQSRFDKFWQARHDVLEAGLDEVESELQIEQLLDQHFGPDERERARLTSFDWQVRDRE